MRTTITLPSRRMSALAAAILALAASDASGAARRNPAAVQVSQSSAPIVAPQFAENGEPLLGIVSLSQQRISIWQGSRMVAESPISSGQDGYRTPKGVFSIIQKNRYHESNIYSGAPMPFMQRLTWSGIALHAGQLPGYPASHGCVRLPESFASRLFSMTKMGMRVVVADRQTAPTLVTHPNLPAPSFRDAPPGDGAIAARTALAPVALQSGVFTSAAIAAPLIAARKLNPVEVARIEQKRAAADFADAVDNASRHQSLAALAVETHRHAQDDVRRISTVLAQHKATVEILRRRLATAVTDEDRVQADASLHMAEEAAAEVERDLHQARAYDAETADETMQTALATKAALATRDEAEYRARIAARGTEPVSIFISRKQRRAFVRQGFEPVADAAADIVDEDLPIGTHVFTAIGLADDGQTLRWSAVTVPEANVSVPPSDRAIDRVALPAELRDLVASKAWIGASITISDHAPSLETGKGTDFVILTQ